jgi:hypothetical protein
MRRLLVPAISSLALAAPAAFLLGAASASAAAEFGTRRSGDSVAAGRTVLGLANGEQPFPADSGPRQAIGSRTGVIANWPGRNEFAARIPVPEYAHIGLRGPTGGLYCEEVDRGVIGLVEGGFAVGSVGHFELSFPDGVPVTAVVERDGDGDGYGDETQDGCKRRARKIRLNGGDQPIAANVPLRLVGYGAAELEGRTMVKTLNLRLPGWRKPG